MTPVTEQKHPQGMVLLFTLCILALLAILGAVVFLSTKDDAYVSANTAISRDAFTKADFTARIGVFMGRALLHEDIGKPSDTLSAGGVAGRPGFLVELNNFTIGNILDLDSEDVETATRNRYLLALGGQVDVNGDGSNDEPHIRVNYQYDDAGTRRQLVGTASVSYSHPEPLVRNEGEIPTYIVVTSDGRVPTTGRNDSSPPLDPSNYLTGDEYAKHSIVTAIYKEVPQQ